MAAAVGVRDDYDAGALRAAAKRSKNGPQARRLLALAAIYDGATRSETARIGGVGLQVIRDWVLRFNAQGPDGLIDRKAPGQPPRLLDASRGVGGDPRERADPGGSRGCAMADRRSLPMDIRGIPGRRRRADAESRAARDGLSQALGSSAPSCATRGRDRGF
jgi:hypothetical protein